MAVVRGLRHISYPEYRLLKSEFKWIGRKHKIRENIVCNEEITMTHLWMLCLSKVGRETYLACKHYDWA